MAALLAVVAVLGLSGCGWKGDGAEVAAALVATSQIETRSFSGSVTFDALDEKMSKAGADTNMTFRGALDTRDADAPKMTLEMNSGSSATKVVVPGDGKFYLTSGGKTYSVDVPPGGAQKSTVDPVKIYSTLSSAVGSFKQAPSMTNAAGQSVHTVGAKLSKSKLCGPVLDAFGDALSSAGGVGGEFGGSGKGDSKMFKGICESMLASDPRVWFGIDGGKLTDLALSAKLNVPFAGKMKVDLVYHEFNQGAEQSGFEAPAEATPLGSLDQLARAN